MRADTENGIPIMTTKTCNTLVRSPYGIDFVHDPEADYYFVRHNRKEDGAAILAIDALDRAVLVIVNRRPVNAAMLEAPRGGALTGEAPAQTAARELLEETGAAVEPEMLTDLGYIHPDAGTLGYGVHMFGVRLGHVIDRLRKDPEEVSEALLVPMAEVEERIARGQITCGITMSLVARWKLLDHPRGPARRLEIVDVDGRLVQRMMTKRPHQAFVAYCRDRISTGWGYRVS